MKRDRSAREALQAAEGGVAADTSRLVARTPELLRSALRIRAESGAIAPEFDRLAEAALPRLAAATALFVVLAAAFVLKERSPGSAAFESMILGGDDDTIGDAVYDAVFGSEDNDG